MSGTNLGWAATSGLMAGVVIADTLKREEARAVAVEPQDATAGAVEAFDPATPSEPAKPADSARLPQSDSLPVTGPTLASAFDRRDAHPAEGPSVRDAALDGSR